MSESLIWNTGYFSNSQELCASKGTSQNTVYQLHSCSRFFFFLSCFPRINVHCLNSMVSMVHQGCVHTQQGAWAVLSQSVFPSLLVSGSLCLTFKPCLLTLLVKTGLYFSFLECAGLVQVVKWSKLSSFHNINTLLANNNYSTLGVFPLICWCMWGWWWC